MLRIQNLNGGDRWYYSNLKLPDEKYCEAGDLLYAWSASFGPYRFTGPRSIFHYHIWRVIPGNELDKTFAFYLLEKITNEVKSAAHGVAMLHMTKSGIEAWPILVPPLAEQRRIADVLDRVEALRTKRRETLAHLDSLTQSIFLDLFGDPATNPKGWPILKVHQVGDVQGGLQLTSARKSLPREVPYLRVANVYRGFLDLREIKTMRATDVEVERTTLSKDDLLIVEGHGNPAEIGRGALWNGSITNCIHQNHIIRVRFAATKVLPVYACEYLNSPSGRRHLLRAGKTTSGLNTISVSEVRGTPLAVPPLTVQRKFVQQVTAVEKLKTIHRESLVQLNALFDSLQHRAFRGKLYP